MGGRSSSCCCCCPSSQQGAVPCRGSGKATSTAWETAIVGLGFFSLFLALWTLVSPPEVLPCTSNGGAAVGISCGRKPVSLQEVLGYQAGQKNPGAWLLQRPSAPGEGHPPPTPESHPCSVAQVGGGHSGREAGSGGRVRSRSGRDHQVPAGAERVEASFAGCWRERVGHPFPLRLRLLPSPVCPLQCLGTVGRDPPLLHRFAHSGIGGYRPHPRAVLDPGAVALPVLFVYRRQEGVSG